MQPVEYSLRGTKKRPSYSLQRCSAQGQAVIKSAPQVPKYGVKHRHTCTNVHVRRALSLWNSIGGCPHDYTRQQLQVSCVRFASALTCATVARMLEKAPCQIRARIYITLHLLSYYKPYIRASFAPLLCVDQPARSSAEASAAFMTRERQRFQRNSECSLSVSQTKYML